MGYVEWGDPIAVDNARPDWLGEEYNDLPVWWSDHPGPYMDVSTVGELVWTQTLQPLSTIRLPADHPYYSTIRLPADWALTEARNRAPGLGAESNMEWVRYTTSPGAVLMIELARMIEKYEPHLAPVDPDVLAVREILAAFGGGKAEYEGMREGEQDEYEGFVDALAAYRKVKSS